MGDFKRNSLKIHFNPPLQLICMGTPAKHRTRQK